MMKIPIIIQARMGSRRLPGKVLRKIKDRPVIEYLLMSLARSSFAGNIIIATSDSRDDDPIVEYCDRRDIEFFRGPLNNVAKRYMLVVEKHGFKNFVRLSADSPLIDAGIVDDCIKRFKAGNYGIVTNVFKRSFPKGQSVEVFDRDTYMLGYQEMINEDDLEHVTGYFYKNADKFSIFNVASGSDDYSDINLSIDTKEDFDRISMVIERMDRPFIDYGWREIVNIYKEVTQYYMNI